MGIGHVVIGIPCFLMLCMAIVAERLSARQLILRRISEIVSMYVCMYVSVTLRNPIISRANAQT